VEKEILMKISKIAYVPYWNITKNSCQFRNFHFHHLSLSLWYFWY